ncbi:uncharacterized protein MYCFIDRAFT_81181 [Pseudocercospora fijiensis CIRAD86]|uniref:Uncharacterized protein n=1 Tax=Pseudocercospora fijiensis (strain CIRAD86) TaxID=383855 RepID=M2ZKW2_PSEFD|nr:uncharacterized protein MYCFIDRAFT_81181 [Pseudocercospora fijiensis CIRAD86]EME79699.1 hypothetical protein MYCFIDRAFT_81181 [Pseudocercospora fijiensis CIRAD86]
MSEHCGSTSQSDCKLEGRLHELAEQDQQYRPRWGQINSRLAQLKNEYEALMREKNALVEEQGSIRVKVHERNEEYRRTQQAIAALTGARDSDSTRQNGLETAAAPPHGLPTVAKAPNPAMATTSSRIRPTEEVETIIIESDEEEEGEGDEALISVGTASRQLFKPVDAIHGRFPTVVNINGQWHEIRCKGCGANIKSKTSTWFKGLRGLRFHYTRCHLPRGSFAPTAETCCIMRPVSASDIGLMEQGLAPRDVAIEACYAPKMLSESRQETRQASSSVRPSYSEVH